MSKITKELFPAIPDIQVTEFGFAEPFESELESLQTILWDLRRADYYQGYLDNILAALVVDGVNVTGAWGWAVFDSELFFLFLFFLDLGWVLLSVFCFLGEANADFDTDFEWGSGQSTRFGLQHVNYTDLTRTPKASMFTFVNWFKQHGAGSERKPADSA